MKIYNQLDWTEIIRPYKDLYEKVKVKDLNQMLNLPIFNAFSREDVVLLFLEALQTTNFDSKEKEILEMFFLTKRSLEYITTLLHLDNIDATHNIFSSAVNKLNKRILLIIQERLHLDVTEDQLLEMAALREATIRF